MSYFRLDPEWVNPETGIRNGDPDPKPMTPEEREKMNKEIGEAVGRFQHYRCRGQIKEAQS